MPKFTFVGGIHPYDGKDLSKDKPIKAYDPKGDLVYPVSQHIGAPAKPVVKKGDRVLVGQLIAEAGGFVSAPIYATVSGTVKALEDRRVPVGDMVSCIVVENDGLYEEVEWGRQQTTQEILDGVEDGSITRDDIIKLVQQAGVVGMGGAGFPTHVKLSPKEPDKIDYIIANCAECEPYLTSDYRRMMEEPQKLIDGLKIMVSIFPNAKGILAVEDNKPDAIAKLKALTEDEPDISVASLKTQYPQGAERQIIFASTGRAINSSMLPADAGCIVDNVDTIVAIYHAVTEKKPLMHRIVTITGDAIVDPRNFIVRIGTNYSELIDEAGGFKQTPEKIVSGGPMMGFALFGTDVPVTKTSSALLCLTKDEVSRYEPSACINCARCVEGCPSRLVPSRLADLAVNGNAEGFVAMNGMECVECGCCSFVCPAKRHLTQDIKVMRKIQLAARRK